RAETEVTGCLDDVDAGVLPDDGRGFRQNRDAALALEVVRIHHPFGDALVVAEGAGPLQATFDQVGFAMVAMRDDRDVAKCHVFGIPADSCSCRLPAAI